MCEAQTSDGCYVSNISFSMSMYCLNEKKTLVILNHTPFPPLFFKKNKISDVLDLLLTYSGDFREVLQTAV